MKWIVGLDLRPLSHGAIHFATFLAQNSRAADKEQFVGVHVLEEEHLRVVLRYHHLDEVTHAARDSAENVIEREGAAEHIVEVSVIRGLTADKSLEAARVYHHSEALIVGRQAKRESHRVVRLGRVARRLLRTLEAPTIVVPPDLKASDLGSGPIVAFSRLTPDSERACEFASRMASRLGRKLVIAHAVAIPEDYGAQYLPADSLERLRKEHQQEGETALAAWIKDRGLRPDSTAVLQGQVVERAIDFAVAQASPLVVCGSRSLSSLERVLITSVGSELAATAPIPVAVVPPA